MCPSDSPENWAQTVADLHGEPVLLLTDSPEGCSKQNGAGHLTYPICVLLSQASPAEVKAAGGKYEPKGGGA